ncbi:DUF2911 domain-containing protein [Flavivirga spongiicola]|uniref:DUF2911 domain-containing protein n=1 Tax=Flavivirga spongiicola TaxID=421621 RepID=A0ABU7XZK5_9FLAO|nr:DUF2911 domain-containing protein [Flavivirga sp. MEBiC05379]MDO5980865.1 DUF2911 domain-containing protein [Flavivirga sp. MEBiC05379]
MKIKSFTICVMIFTLFVVSNTAMSQVKSPKGNTEIVIEGVEISVDYSRPYKKGRDIFGGLVPYNKYWRTGANLATEISFSKDVKFGGKEIKSGRYRLYTIPGKTKWIVKLNSELGKKGFYEPNYDLDVLEVSATPKAMKQELEQFTIILKKHKKGAKLIMKWDMTKVVVPITLK